MSLHLHILFTGNYLVDYNRTEILSRGLKELGHQVTHLPFEKLSQEVKDSLKKHSKAVDFIFMPPFTHKEVLGVRECVGDKFIAFDPLISRYLTKVYDYKLVWPWSLSALRNYCRDKKPMQAADFVFTDTLAHKNYFHEKFKIPLDKMSPLYIGNDFQRFYPEEGKTTSDVFRVGFYGGFIPLQGVMNILAAAQSLKDHEDIQFELVGNGFEYEKAKNFIAEAKLKNVQLPGWLSEADLRQKISSFDVCLGIFGDTVKSHLVIPNKVYHYMACKKPVISQDTSAMREIFSDEDVLFTEADPSSIVRGILKLKKDKNLGCKLAENAYNKLKTKYDAAHIAAHLVETLGPRLK